MSFNPRLPYNDLPDLPPTADIETKAILRRCISARVSLAELRVSGRLIPNQSVLINSLPLLEAQASSEIENIVTTTDCLFRSANAVDRNTDPATRETLRYRTALYYGIKMLERSPISTEMAIAICQSIKGVDLSVRKTPGTALINDVSQEVIYTPPMGEEVIRAKLANWERYIHSHLDVDPLIRLAVMHYQFEAIHPFIDGNGRTGRVLNLLYLVENKLLDVPVLYLSRYILQHKAAYYQRLSEVTSHQAWEDWILFMLDAIRTTAVWTNNKIHSIRKLLDKTSDTIRQELSKIYSRELTELIFVNPYCRIRNVTEAGIVKRQTAAGYLKVLASEGILDEIKVGREKLYVNVPFLNLLTSR